MLLISTCSVMPVGLICSYFGKYDKTNHDTAHFRSPDYAAQVNNLKITTLRTFSQIFEQNFEKYTHRCHLEFDSRTPRSFQTPDDATCSLSDRQMAQKLLAPKWIIQELIIIFLKLL